MKLFIGILSVVLILTGATLTILALWDIQPISWSVIWRSGATIGIACITYLVIWIIKFVFFGKDLFSKSKEQK